MTEDELAVDELETDDELDRKQKLLFFPALAFEHPGKAVILE